MFTEWTRRNTAAGPSFFYDVYAVPLLLHEQLPDAGELGVWRVHESEDWFRLRLQISPAEIDHLATLRSERHRREWWASRYLLHQMSGRHVRGAILKDQFGKPRLAESRFEISLSHSWELVSVIAAPVAVGVDVQRLVPKITRLAPRFMRPEEHAALTAATLVEQLHVCWGAKEALYKAYGRRQLDFRAHIHLDPFQYLDAGGQLAGRVVLPDLTQHYRIDYQRLDHYILVYALRTGTTSTSAR